MRKDYIACFLPVLPPDTGFPDIYRDLSLPALENLIAKCSSDEDESEGLEAWLCRALGVENSRTGQLHLLLC